MNYLQEKIATKKHEILVLTIMTAIAFMMRFGALILYEEAAGDGPARAIQAYLWSQSPSFVTQGIWVPGFLYLSGLFSFVINSPLISARILNMIFGTLCIPFFYLLVRSLYDREIALVSALILMIFPLHIGLSVTSLTEISFLFEMIAGTYLLILASENYNKIRAFYLFFALLLLCLALMTRNESWMFIPLYPCYYYYKTKRIFESILVLIILMSFPILWMFGNYQFSGHLLPAFKTAVSKAVEGGTEKEDLTDALLRLGMLLRSYMWWILPVISALGIFFNIDAALKRRLNAKQLLYFLIVVFNGIFIIKFIMDRGQTFWFRYILFALITALPFAAYAIKRLFYNSSRMIIILAVIVLVLSPLGSQLIYKKDLYLRSSHPQYIIELAQWLKSSLYRNDYILVTKMDWKATLLPLYFPDISDRLMIVSGWFSGPHFRDRVNNSKPSLFIFREGDEKYKLRIEEILERRITKEYLVGKIGQLQLYEITDLYK